jgi:AcrR family transcriptional regulator
VNVQTTTITVRRRLTPSQQVRRERILEVAMALAARGGAEAVQMKTVAARARVSLGTIYRDFASKDDLLAEALLAFGQRLGARLRAWPPRGKTPAKRIGATFLRLAKGIAEKPELGVALTATLLSRDPGADAQRDALTALLGDWIDLAVGEADVVGRAHAVEILQHVALSWLLGLAQGRHSPREVGDALERAAARLFPKAR